MVNLADKISNEISDVIVCRDLCQHRNISSVEEGWRKENHALTKIKHLEDLSACIARASAGETAVVVIATASRGVAAGAGVREVTRRRRDKVAGIGRPAEAIVQVELGPVIVGTVDLAIGLEHDGPARVTLEVDQTDLRAGLQKAAGDAIDAGWAESSDKDDFGCLHSEDWL